MTEDLVVVRLLVLYASQVTGYIIVRAEIWTWKFFPQNGCRNCTQMINKKKKRSCVSISRTVCKCFRGIQKAFGRSCLTVHNGYSTILLRPNNANKVSSSRKVMAVVFWDLLGIFFVDYKNCIILAHAESFYIKTTQELISRQLWSRNLWRDAFNLFDNFVCSRFISLWPLPNPNMEKKLRQKKKICRIGPIPLILIRRSTKGIRVRGIAYEETLLIGLWNINTF